MGLTTNGAITGTPAFMSPEQAGGVREIDQRSDIYSLGAVAYFLLTGRPPFVHPTSVQTMAAHLSELVVPPNELNPAIPAEIVQIVGRCLEKDPERRYPDVSAVESALAGCACRGTWSSEQAAGWWDSFDDEGSSLARSQTLPQNHLSDRAGQEPEPER